MSNPGKKIRARYDSFKSIHVGKFNNLEEKIEKLPNDKLKNNWNNRKFKEFLEEFKGIIPNVADLKSEEQLPHNEINATLPFLPELGYSFDRNVHSEIDACYSKLLDLYGDMDKKDNFSTAQSVRRNLASSISKYVDNILCTEGEKICPDIKRLSTFLLKNCEEQTFKVEEEIGLVFQKQQDVSVSRFFRHTEYVLQQIALNFMDKLFIYPLASKFPKRPGVYFIYHVGKTQLYQGSQVFPSTRDPVYVGMSQTNIAGRLEDHLEKIKAATKTKKGKKTKGVKLELSDFFVRFMIVDIKHYIPCIESMLIEYFSPVWNSQAMAFSFGNAKGPKNLWHKFHIRKDSKTIEMVLSKLKI